MKKVKSEKRSFRLFPKKNNNENIFQYLFRQTLLSDSRGNPSWTLTVMALVLLLVANIAVVESQLAFKTVTIIDVAGKTTTSVKGFSSEFMYLVIGLTMIIITFFQNRSKRQNNETDQNQEQSVTEAMQSVAQVSPKLGMVSSVVSTIAEAGKNLISKVIKK